uniref:Putative secreted protein n=1 Tax=Ixodes ricinus TaxID=34613 RepID=A0A6B0US05_IXORI
MIGPGHLFLVFTCAQTRVCRGPPKKRVPAVGHTYSINFSHIFENACCAFGHAGCQLRWANRNRDQWDFKMLCAALGLLGCHAGCQPPAAPPGKTRQRRTTHELAAHTPGFETCLSSASARSADYGGFVCVACA